MAHRKSPNRIAKERRVRHLETVPPTAHVAAAAAPARLGRLNVARLEADIAGHVVLPDDPQYDTDRQESNPAFQEYPQIIVYCAAETDVVKCVNAARDAGMWVAVRSGGHSTAGYSVNDGMVIDVSTLSYVVLDESRGTVTAGVGTDFDHFNMALDGTGWHVPTGACGNVCVGGFVQGGGYGYTSRAFGIQSDCVLSFRVVLANVTVVNASEIDNPDLFWALRGGTGGNFGVVTQVTYRAVRLASVWAWAISWDAAHAAEALALLQSGYTSACPHDALGYMMNLGFYKDRPVYMVQGMYCGPRDAGHAALRPLLDIPSARLLVDKTGTYPQMNNYLENEPYPLPYNMPDSPPSETKASYYIGRQLARAEWQSIVDYFNTAKNHWTMVYTEPYGGAINRYPVDASAFVHRNVDLNLVIDTVWIEEPDHVAAVEWLRGFREVLAPMVTGAVYQNYPDASLSDYRMAYWGNATFERLLTIKRRYDPDNFFVYAQSIQPRIADAARTAPHSASRSAPAGMPG